MPARLDPRFISPIANLAGTLAALNQFDEAATVIDGARAAGIEHLAIRQLAYFLAFVKEDTARMDHELEAALATPDGPVASNWQPRISAFGGLIEKAHDSFRRSALATSEASMIQLSGLYHAQDGVSHAVVGQCADARPRGRGDGDQERQARAWPGIAGAGAAIRSRTSRAAGAATLPCTFRNSDTPIATQLPRLTTRP